MTDPVQPKNALIAVVEDDPKVCTGLRRLLRSAGYDVATFPSGEAFIHWLRGQLPDGLLLDLHLPGVSGWDVHRHLATSTESFPVIAITGRDDPGIAQKARAAGMAALFLKPFDGTELLRLLSHLVRN